MAICVRRATLHDSSAVRQMLVDLSRHIAVTDSLLHPDVSVDDLHKLGMLCYVSYETTARRPVGLCLASRYYYLATGHMLIIIGIYVDPAYRRRGICSAMVRALLHDGSVQNITRVDAEVPESEEAALIAFTALGFHNLSASMPMMVYKLPDDAYQQLISKRAKPGVSDSVCGPSEEATANSVFKLRVATPEDAGHVMRMMTELEEMHNNRVQTNSDILLADMQSGCFCGVVVEDASDCVPMGQGILVPYYSIKHGASARINELILAEKDCGKGLGGAMIQASCRLAKSQGIKFMDLAVAVWNERARKVYEHLGFIRDPVVVFTVDEENVRRLRARETKAGIILE